MSSDDTWREYDIHTEEDGATSHQPVDIFATAEEQDAYQSREYTFTHPSDGKEVTISLREQEDYEVSTGTSIWKGSEILCDYLIAHPDRIRGKRVLELGAGVGLCGIVCAKLLGAAAVQLTDGDHVVLRNLRRNATSNGLDTNAACRQLIWGDSKAAEFEKIHGQFDAILATDCVYVTKSVRPLFETVQRLLAPGGAFLFVNSCASTCPLEEALRIGEGLGLSSTPEEMWRRPGDEKDPVYVFRRGRS